MPYDCRRRREKISRKVTGAGWSLVIDEETKCPYWYNEDTGDASYSRPAEVEALEVHKTALSRGYSACPHFVLLQIFAYLCPYPDRNNAAVTCASWRSAAQDTSFFRRVLSVEAGARESGLSLKPREYSSLNAAVTACSAGDTIIISCGHHWDGDIRITRPLRILSEMDDPSKCVVEIGGQITVAPVARSVIICGFTLRRPKKLAQAKNLLRITDCKCLV